MQIDFIKNNDLVPVIIQDNRSLQVLMLGYMDQAAYDKTISEDRITFYSRSKQRLWTKGEKSGNFLFVNDLSIDCDQDTILIKATPVGPTCHLGTKSCFGEEDTKGFLYQLQETISQRIDSNDEKSYTNALFRKGINKVAQKVGEEAIELVIESKDENDDLFLGEAADLLYHFLILLKAKKMKLEDVEDVLIKRQQTS